MANLFSENPIVEIVAVPGRDGTEITIDDRLSDTSENPVQNKIVKQAIDNAVTVTEDFATQAVEAAYGQLDEAKQDVLVDSGAGQNIKTINNESVLGTGNLEINTEVETDNELSNTSVNPVKNYVIKNAIDTVNSNSKHYTDVEVGRTASIINTEIQTIEGKIPAQASTENQLADKDFVNSSINTATATFKGTFNTLAALQATDGDKNDYAFYSHTDSAGNKLYDRYKYVGSSVIIVPDEYTQLQGAEVGYSGGGYIDTGIKINSGDSIYVKYYLETNVHASYFFGASDSNNNLIALGKIFNSGSYFKTNLDTLSINYISEHELYVINNMLYLDDSLIGTMRITTVNSNIYIFGYNNNGSYTGPQPPKSRLYSFIIFDSNGNKRIELVPCKRNSDNSVGFYDTVKEYFILPINGALKGIPISSDKWAYEYSLNNSSFTAAQWAAINSGLVQHVTSAGYNAGATQVLKNINGVIQWVTE